MIHKPAGAMIHKAAGAMIRKPAGRMICKAAGAIKQDPQAGPGVVVLQIPLCFFDETGLEKIIFLL